MGKGVRSWQAFVIVLMSVFAFFINNEVITPDIMEARNIVTAREMVDDGHWLVPTMNGELRLEKPPLPTWLTAVAQMVSPDNLALQRGMAGAAGVLLVIFFYLTVKLVVDDRRHAFLSTAILMTCYNIVLMGRTATWDIYCHAFMMCGIYFLLRALKDDGRQWGDFTLAGLAMGLSFMSKGPVSFFGLLLPMLLALIATYRPHMRGKWLPVLLMVLVTVVLSGWWYGYLWAFHHDAVVAVTTKETGSWVNHNVRPWWYYWKFFLEAGIWAPLLLTAIFLPLSHERERRDVKWRFFVLWLLLAVVLLSLMPEKKSRYLLPVMMPAAATMGYLAYGWAMRFKHREEERGDNTLFKINGWVIVALTVALPVAVWKMCLVPGYVSTTEFVVLTVLLLSVASYMVSGIVKKKPHFIVYGVVMLFAIAEVALLPAFSPYINNPDRKSVALTKTVPELRGVPYYYNSSDSLRIEIVYAAGRKIRPLDVTNPDSVEAHLPLALFTHKSVGDELPAAVLERVDTTTIGHYDDNSRPKQYKRRYDEIFLYNVTLLRKK